MIIIWGTKNRQERLGSVADWCPACRQVQPFTVTKYFRVGHIYYIPLGRGTHTATVRQCWECGSQYRCEEEDYDDFLPDETVEQMSTEDLLRQTNAELERRLDAAPRARANRRDDEPDVADVLPANEEMNG